MAFAQGREISPALLAAGSEGIGKSLGLECSELATVEIAGRRMMSFNRDTPEESM